MSQLLFGSISLDVRSSNITYTSNWIQGGACLFMRVAGSSNDRAIPENTDLFDGTDIYSSEQGASAILSFYRVCPRMTIAS
jgi:hypothetical protein